MNSLQGCHGQGKSLENEKKFWVREKSVIFISVREIKKKITKKFKGKIRDFKIFPKKLT